MRLLKAMRDASRRQQRQDVKVGKRKASLVMFVPAKKRDVVMPESNQQRPDQ